MASIASVSSGPSVSSTTRLPLPAASIITPMMLFAFTLRPLRANEISHWYFAASWVSFAAARACSPSLLMISVSRCSIGRDVHVQHAVAAAADRLLDHRLHALVAVCERSHQHGQVDAGDRLDSAARQELRGQVARCGAVDIGKDQHAVAGVERGDQLARLWQQRRWIVACRYLQRGELGWTAAEHVADRARQAFAQRIVSDDQDADHDGLPRIFCAAPPGSPLRDACCRGA